MHLSGERKSNRPSQRGATRRPTISLWLVQLSVLSMGGRVEPPGRRGAGHQQFRLAEIGAQLFLDDTQRPARLAHGLVLPLWSLQRDQVQVLARQVIHRIAHTQPEGWYVRLFKSPMLGILRG